MISPVARGEGALSPATQRRATSEKDTMSSVDKNRQASLEAGKRKVSPRSAPFPHRTVHRRGATPRVR